MSSNVAPFNVVAEVVCKKFEGGRPSVQGWRIHGKCRIKVVPDHVHNSFSPSAQDLYHPDGWRLEIREIGRRASWIGSQQTILCPAKLTIRTSPWSFLRTLLRNRRCARSNSKRKQASSDLCPSGCDDPKTRRPKSSDAVARGRRYQIPSDPWSEQSVSDKGDAHCARPCRFSLVWHAGRVGSIRRLQVQSISTCAGPIRQFERGVRPSTFHRSHWRSLGWLRSGS